MMLDAAEGLTRTESSALVDVVLKEIADAIARCETVNVVVWVIHGAGEEPAHLTKSENRRRSANWSFPMAPVPIGKA